MSLSIWKDSGAASSIGNGLEPEASVKNNFGGGGRLDACIRCGSCAAVCPTYREAASERLGARGRVTLLTKFQKGEIGHTAAFDGSVFSCVLCGACSAVCPRGVEVAYDVYGARSILWKAERRRRLVAHGVKLALMKPGLLSGVLRSLQGVAAYLPVKSVWPFRQLRDMGLSFPRTSLRDGSSFFRVPHARGRVAVMAGCTVNFLYPHIGHALVKVLNALRYEVIVPKGEVCCGAPHLAMGLTEDGERMAEKNLTTFGSLNAEAVVSPCPTCVHVIREEYTRRFGGGVAHALDATQLLDEHGEDLIRLGHEMRGREAEKSAVREAAKTNAIFHDPCHALYYLKIKEEPRRIVRSLSYTLTEGRDKDCCGFGGTFRFLNPELSDGMAKRRAAAFAGADVVVTSCPNCIFQLKGAIKDTPVRHLVELVGERIGVMTTQVFP